MKRFILVAFLVAIHFCSFGQNTMKFLGIPIDGTKEQMISALKNKGYTYDSLNDCLSGEFNGQNVDIFIKTNNNKVCRICVADASLIDETNIRIRFNSLLDQFMRNGKYVHVGGNIISDSEKISHEIIVNKKRYEIDMVPSDKSINGIVWYMIVDQYGRYRIAIYYENLDNMPNGDDL